MTTREHKARMLAHLEGMMTNEAKTTVVLSDPIEFSERIIKAMSARGVSFRQVQEQSGVDHSAVPRATTGYEISLANYMGIQRWLGSERDVKEAARQAAIHAAIAWRERNNEATRGALFNAVCALEALGRA